MSIARGDARSGVDFALDPGLSISGVVTDLEGKPLEGIRVSTRREFSVNMLSGVNTISRSKGARTGADGAFTINGLAKGKYTLRASGGIYMPGSVADVETGVSDARIRLEVGGTVHGRVTDTRTGEGIENFNLKVTRGQYDRRFSGNILKGEEAAARIGGAETDGVYVVEGVGEDALNITFSADGYADVEMTGIAAAPGQSTELSCSLVPESRVAGVVFTPGGEGLADCTVTLREKPEGGAAADTGGIQMRRLGIRAGSDGVEYVSDEDAWTRSVETGPDGRFLFKGVPEGEYTIEADHGEFVTPAPLDVSVVEGGRTAGLEITMRAGGAVACQQVAAAPAAAGPDAPCAGAFATLGVCPDQAFTRLGHAAADQHPRLIAR